MFEALCVKGSVPLHGAVLSGNTSDKKANTAELTRVARYLKKHGLDPAACIYVADSALVSADNLEALRGQPFITRLPAIYKVAQAAVAYSNAHDKRRTRKLEKQLTAEKEAFAKLAKAALREPFACAADAQRHAAALLRENRYACHTIQAEVRAEPVYARGRPKQGGPRKVRAYRHRIHLRLRENSEAIARARERAGCFVLLSNVPAAGQAGGLDGAAVQRAYKAQNGVEMNFRFLKDPVIVNETFLKKAERIEALGFILLLSLMVWNLIQKVLRDYLAKHRKSILGWDKKQTRRPTTLMVLFSDGPLLLPARERLQVERRPEPSTLPRLAAHQRIEPPFPSC